MSEEQKTGSQDKQREQGHQQDQQSQRNTQAQGQRDGGQHNHEVARDHQVQREQQSPRGSQGLRDQQGRPEPGKRIDAPADRHEQAHELNPPETGEMKAPRDRQAGAAGQPMASADLESGGREWERAKSMAKQTWSTLNDADFNKAGRSLETLYDVIHQKVGGSKEAIQKKLDKLLA